MATATTANAADKKSLVISFIRFTRRRYAKKPWLEAVEVNEVNQVIPEDTVPSPRRDDGHENDDIMRDGVHHDATYSPPIPGVNGEYSDG